MFDTSQCRRESVLNSAAQPTHSDVYYQTDSPSTDSLNQVICDLDSQEKENAQILKTWIILVSYNYIVVSTNLWKCTTCIPPLEYWNKNDSEKILSL